MVSTTFDSLFIFLFCSLTSTVCSLECMQCMGEVFREKLSLSRDKCCRSEMVQCLTGEVCIRAQITSPSSRFYLSGCFPAEDGLVGCESHNLPMNATVYRCICHDAVCQNYFPGQCNKHHHNKHHKNHISIHHKTNTPRPPSRPPTTTVLPEATLAMFTTVIPVTSSNEEYGQTVARLDRNDPIVKDALVTNQDTRQSLVILSAISPMIVMYLYTVLF